MVRPRDEVKELIWPYTGNVELVGHDSRSFTDLTMVLDADGGRVFVKAMRNRPGGRRDQLLREREINPFVREFAPRLLWSAENEDWTALGFEYVTGRQADYSPDSPDLLPVIRVLDRLALNEPPEVAREWRETRWDWWADEGDAAHFVGNTLLHADMNPDNFLVGEQRVWLVDWAWPTVGAAFIDPALLVAQLVAAHHPVEAAEQQLTHCPAWADADSAAIDAFVIAYARMTRVRAARQPDRPWVSAMADAVGAWARHRRLTDFM